MIVGHDGPGVVLSARMCAWLESKAKLTALRVTVRGLNPEVSRALEEIRWAAMQWRSSATGTSDDTTPEPATDSEQWLSTGQAAALLGMTDRGIRKAIAEHRLDATLNAGTYRISREDLEHYRAERRPA